MIYFMRAEDAMALWLAERCVVRSSFYATAKELFADWKKWAEPAGEFVGSQKRLAEALEARGFTRRRQAGNGRWGFDGIGVKSAEPAWQDDPL